MVPSSPKSTMAKPARNSSVHGAPAGPWCGFASATGDGRRGRADRRGRSVSVVTSGFGCGRCARRAAKPSRAVTPTMATTGPQSATVLLAGVAWQAWPGVRTLTPSSVHVTGPGASMAKTLIFVPDWKRGRLAAVGGAGGEAVAVPDAERQGRPGVVVAEDRVRRPVPGHAADHDRLHRRRCRRRGPGRRDDGDRRAREHSEREALGSTASSCMPLRTPLGTAAADRPERGPPGPPPNPLKSIGGSLYRLEPAPGFGLVGRGPLVRSRECR